MDTETHLSDLALDRIAGGGSEPAHLEVCATCRAQLAERRLERERFAPRRLPVAPRPRPRTTRVRGATVAAGSLLAAALVLVVARSPHHAHDVDLADVADGGLRTKGLPEWSDFDVLVKRPHDTHASHVEGAVAAGDTLQWVAGPEVDGHVVIYNIDGTGARTQVHPAEGGTQRLAAGPMRPLSSALTLDDAPGPEQIVAVFCESPFAADLVLQHLDAPAEVLPAGCRVARREFSKVGTGSRGGP